MWTARRLSFEPENSAHPYDRRMSPRPVTVVAQAEDRVFSAGMPHQDVDCAAQHSLSTMSVSFLH
jgi:hypothetical protein